MSARGRAWLAALAALALLASGLALSGGERVDRERGPGEVAEGQRIEELRRQAGARAEAEHRRAARHAARREDPQDELGPRPRDLARLERLRSRLEPLARRFFSAFARYELGHSSRALARTLAASATRRFARELLNAPPRSLGGWPGRPASLARAELVPDRVVGGRIATAELVGLARRARGTSPIAIELRLTPRGWRVAGLGR